MTSLSPTFHGFHSSFAVTTLAMILLTLSVPLSAEAAAGGGGGRGGRTSVSVSASVSTAGSCGGAEKGGHRGRNTRQISILAEKLYKSYAEEGTSDRQYLCAVKGIAGSTSDEDVIQWLASYLSRLIGKDEADIADVLNGKTSCNGASSKVVLRLR